MQKNLWTEEEITFLRQNYRKLSAEQLSRTIGRPLHATQLKAYKLGLHKPHPRKINLDTEQTQWLRLNFPHITNRLCAMRLGISERSVVRLARKMRLTKTPDFMADCQAYTAHKARQSNITNDNSGQFPKGHVPHNKKRYKDQ